MGRAVSDTAWPVVATTDVATPPLASPVHMRTKRALGREWTAQMPIPGERPRPGWP